jgi:hypothetical protein
MAASSAAEYGNLLVTNLLRICTDHDFMSYQADRPRLKYHQPLEHFFDDVFRAINELFHDKT